MHFEDLQTTKMGDYAESITINAFAQSKGYLAHPAPKQAHIVDAICIAKNKKSFGLEIKCKTAMKYRPQTGIDANDYFTYMTFDLPVYLLIVDPGNGTIYGNWIKNIPGEFDPRNNMMYLSLSAMTHYRNLTTQEQDYLRSLEQSNY